MIQSLIGKKLGQTQGFLENGNRIPMTRIWVNGNVVSQIKTMEKDGYEALQLGFSENKKAHKPQIGHAKKSGLKVTPRFYRESKADKIEDHELGSAIEASEVVAPGDIIDVTGVSKGKGFAGVVKRHHFKGGPKTHGQSDRHRAPGSIGQSTTPGRVYKGKRMAGRMGNEQVTIKNLEVIELRDGELLVKGLVPGPIGTIVTITRIGENKKHMGLYKEPTAEEVIDEAKVEEIGESIEEQQEMRQEVEAKADEEEKAEKEAAQGLTGEDVKEEKAAEAPVAEATKEAKTEVKATEVVEAKTEEIKEEASEEAVVTASVSSSDTAEEVKAEDAKDETAEVSKKEPASAEGSSEAKEEEKAKA